MSFTLVIKDEALQEMLEAYLYYEEQQDGLGEKFLSAVEKRFNDLITHPEYYSYIDNKQILRDITVGVFPYLIVYRIVDDEVRIYSVFNTYKNTHRK